MKRINCTFPEAITRWVTSGWTAAKGSHPCNQVVALIDLRPHLSIPLGREWIHAVTQQIPAPRQHLARYYGAYSNRKRKAMRSAQKAGGDQTASETQCVPPTGFPEGEQAHRRPRPSWARLLHRIFEIDPLLCPKCGTEMQVVSVITEPETIDKILKHIAHTGGRDPFERRGPPGEAAGPVEGIA